MPTHRSAKKRLKTNEKSRVANKSVRSAIHTSLKKIRTAETRETAEQEMPRLFSLMDKAAKKHKANFTANKVANYKSKVHQALNSLSSGSKPESGN